MMAALARVVHNRQGAAEPEHNRRENNRQGDLHGDLATTGPPNLLIGPFQHEKRAKHFDLNQAANGTPHDEARIIMVFDRPMRREGAWQADERR